VYARSLTSWIERTGRWAVDGVAGLGRFSAFSIYALSYVPVEMMSRRAWGRLLTQCRVVGAQSVPVVMITGIFVGMVLAVQAYRQFDAAGLTNQLGAVVNISVVSELGPVLAGVMLAGRIGGALTAELGTMNVTEQLLALRSMGTDPVRYLVAPRFLACLLLTPLLTAYADAMGSFGAWLITVKVYDTDPAAFWLYTRQSVEMWDVNTGLLKSLFFGGTLGMISCYTGFHCERGAEGVGRACTQAFVASFIAIMALDFFLNVLLNGIYEVLYGFRPIF
jgi:phospholipid/cholesterol/gamma-HCH transport system permease protein